MDVKKRNGVLAAFCAAALFLGLLLSQGAAAAREDVIFIAVDEQIIPPAADTMPVWRGGTVYAPYTVFDETYSEVDLDIQIAPQPNRGRVTLFNKSASLSFYPGAQEIIDNSTGEVMPYTTFYRNGTIYVPVVYTARFFGLDTYYKDTEYGDLIRIKSAAVILEDAGFLDAAQYTLRIWREEYLKSIAATPSPSPTATAAVPSPAPSPGVTPVPGAKNDVRVYLAFHHVPGGDIEAVLDLLDRAGVYGLFLLAPGDLRESADAVRRIAGSGHSVGLAVSGTDIAAVEGQLAEGNRLLEGIARLRTRIVHAGDGGRVAEELAGADWICWRGNVDGVPGANDAVSTLATAVIRAADAKKSVARITMDDSTVSVRALARILSALREAGYQLRPAVETEI